MIHQSVWRLIRSCQYRLQWLVLRDNINPIFVMKMLPAFTSAAQIQMHFRVLLILESRRSCLIWVHYGFQKVSRQILSGMAEKRVHP